MSAKQRIWCFLRDKGSATNAEIAEHMRGTRGQLSWGQRLREIRQDLQAKGDDLKCTEIKPGIYLYKIVRAKYEPEPARPENEETICAVNAHAEEAIAQKAADLVHYKEKRGQLAWI